jgi:hypothetical protein
MRKYIIFPESTLEPVSEYSVKREYFNTKAFRTSILNLMVEALSETMTHTISAEWLHTMIATTAQSNCQCKTEEILLPKNNYYLNCVITKDEIVITLKKEIAKIRMMEIAPNQQ